MPDVKTAISMQQSLFEQVEALAQEMEISRSRLFVLAVEDFIQRRQNYHLLEAVNHAYADQPEPNEENQRRQTRQKHRQMMEGQW